MNIPSFCEKRNNGIFNTIDNSEMIFIPAGEFIMGSDDLFTAKPSHTVYMSDYLVDRYPVCNSQFKIFIKNDGYKNKKYWSSEGWELCQADKWKEPRFWNYEPWCLAAHPVVGITWYEAYAYCNWAQKKLPSEAQWEKAARGGFWLDGDVTAQIKNAMPDRKYPWGNEPPFFEEDYYAVFAKENNYGNKSSAPVKLYPQGQSPYKCYTMSGNVWEWCNDWYFRKEYQKENHKDNPVGPSEGEEKILRGGSWCREEKELLVSFRTKDFPNSAGWDLSGFRGTINC